MQTLKNKKVFLTGHTGFKGAWLTFMLHQMGAEVMGYSLSPNTNPSLFEVLHGENLCHSVIGDIRDTEHLHKCMTNFQPDIVFHLAAQPIVRTSYQIPAETFEVNAIGTANVLDGIRLLDNPCVGVMITTDKVYQNNETGQAYKEDDRFGGYDPYSASKACAELVIESYRKSFFNPADYGKHQKAIASARAGNVIGGGDWAADRLIPDIVRALSKGEAVQIRNPKAVRPWQHVLEPLSGYILLAQKLEIRFRLRHLNQLVHMIGELPYVHLMVGMVQLLNLLDWHVTHNHCEGHSRIPLIPCQCPASPVFLAAIHGVSGLYPLHRQAAALDHFVCQLNARFPDQRIDIALFKQRRNAGRYKQVEKHLNIIMQIIHGKVKHACQRCPGLLQIQLIVSVDHPASSPRSESA